MLGIRISIRRAPAPNPIGPAILLGGWLSREMSSAGPSNAGFAHRPVLSTFSDVCANPGRGGVVGRDDAVGGLDVGLAVDAKLGDEAGVQARDALFAALGGESALLERLEVALGRAFDTGNLGGDRATLLIERWSLALRLLLGGAEGVVWMSGPSR
jgi:hypothetical protein